jgi:Mn2+/Fe2+ NRAMP family transporter
MHCKTHHVFLKVFKNIGPGTLIAAAFIGPGTVTVCTLAGARFGYTLLWAMVLSIIATIILQEMAARLGLITGKGLPEILKDAISNTVIRNGLIVLILAAIVVGNAAYEAGNIAGGVMGLNTMYGAQWYFPLLLGAVAFTILFYGNYKVLEKVLVMLVIIMGISFIATAAMIGPDFKSIFKGLFTPVVTTANIYTIIALVGTTVVPYNLFLHASLVSEKWSDSSSLKAARWDTVLSVIVGGFISMSIIVAATVTHTSGIASGKDLALALEPLFGSFSTYVFSVGILAAGITSAITAPLAAAYVVKGCLGWKDALNSSRFRAVWMFILALGVLLASLGLKPVELITFAQIANGLLLPLVAIVLLWLVNRRFLGRFKNGNTQNIIALAVIFIAIILGVKTLLKVFEIS